jgi:negative regulator of flagellin synthesis FlgM
MAIGIRNETLSPPSTAARDNKVTQTSDRATAPAATETEKSEGVKFSLTETASRLTGLAKGLARESTVNQEQVHAIRNAIENGSYRPDPLRIASKLLSTERLMSGRRVDTAKT